MGDDVVCSGGVCKRKPKRTQSEENLDSTLRLETTAANMMEELGYKKSYFVMWPLINELNVKLCFESRYL